MNFESIIYIIEFLIAVGFIVWFLYDMKKYVYRIRVKEVIKGRTIQRTFMAKEVLDEDKVKWLRLKGEKDKTKRLISMPPEECLDIDFKAKKCSDAYRFHNGDIIWIKDSLNVSSDIPEFVMDEKTKELYNALPEEQKPLYIVTWKKEQELKWRKENNIVTPYQPVTTNQRMAYFSNLRKAESRKHQDLKTLLMQQLPLIALVIVVLGLMALYGEIAKPVLEANNQMVQISNNNKLVVEKLDEMNKNIQKIDSEVKTLKTYNQSVS